MNIKNERAIRPSGIAVSRDLRRRASGPEMQADRKMLSWDQKMMLGLVTLGGYRIFTRPGGKPPFLPCVATPEFFSHPSLFKTAILPAGKFGPVHGKPHFHDFCSKVASVRKSASFDHAVVRSLLVDVGPYHLSPTQADHRGFCDFAIGMIQFGCVNSCETDRSSLDDDRVSVDDPARPGKVAWPGEGGLAWRGAEHNNARQRPRLSGGL